MERRKIEKVYERSYVNPFNADGSRKPNRLLGEFAIIQTLFEDDYDSQKIGILVGTNRVFLIEEREVTGFNSGSRYQVKELVSVMPRVEEDFSK